MLKSSLLDESISISVLNIYTNMGLSGTPNNGKENISYELGDLYLLAHSIDGVAQEMIFFVPFFK